MCLRKVWKKGLMTLAVAGMCFATVPSVNVVNASEPVADTGTDNTVNTLDDPVTGHTVTVAGGSVVGGNTYAKDSIVIITADAPASGKVFSKWTTQSQGVVFADESASLTTFKMPDSDVTVTANYDNEPKTPSSSNNSTPNTNGSQNSQNTQDTDSRIITDNDRSDADEDLYYYMLSLERKYNLDKKVMQNLHQVFDSAVFYIANTDMTVAELWSYVSSVKGNMESTAVGNVTTTTSEFLQVGDNWTTPTVSYGNSVSIVLPIINFGTEELNDLIVAPQTSTIVSEWPFVPDKTAYIQTEPYIPGNKTYDLQWQTGGSLPLILLPGKML